VGRDYEKNNEIKNNINKSELGVRGITIYVLKNHVRCQKLNKEKIKKRGTSDSIQTHKAILV